MRIPIGNSSPAICVMEAVGLAMGWLCPLVAPAGEPEVAASNEVAQRDAIPETDTTETTTLSTIVVTAQKRSENLQDVAMAVSAFDGAALREVGVTDALQLQTVVPSLTYVTTGYAAQPYLRGIGTRQSPIGMEPSVATYVDDRYVTRPFAAMFDMLDVERVEVLKGPQGTLYGRNAAGGAIRAITKDPGRDPSMEIGGKIGDHEHAALRVLGGGPLSDALRGQITAAIEKRDGFATNLVPSGRRESDDLDRQSLRASCSGTSATVPRRSSACRGGVIPTGRAATSCRPECLKPIAAALCTVV